MSPKQEDHVIVFIRDEFAQLHAHLKTQDEIFAQHVIEDRATATLAVTTDQSLKSIKRGVYIAWGVITTVLGLIIAYVKL